MRGGLGELTFGIAFRMALASVCAGGAACDESGPGAGRAGDGALRGNLSREAVMKVVHKKRPIIRGCYDAALASNPGLSGRIMLHWWVSPAGEVTELEIESASVFDGELEDCVYAEVQTWRFDPPEGGGAAEVHYPFVFLDVEKTPLKPVKD